jgi:hypothetical protein
MGAVVGAVVVAAAIVGSLSLSRKMILRVSRKDRAARMRRSSACLASSGHESVVTPWEMERGIKLSIGFQGQWRAGRKEVSGGDVHNKMIRIFC